MQKSAIKEPIYLAMLKRKSKVDEEHHKNDALKENIKYDLQSYQESMDTHKARQTNRTDERGYFSSQNNHRAQSSGINLLSNQQKKIGINRLMDVPSEESFLRSVTYQNISQNSLTNIPKQSLNDENRTTFHKQNSILDQPQLLNLKARAIRTINNCKADVLREIKLFQSNNVESSIQDKCNFTKSKQPLPYNGNSHKEEYERRIKELQDANQQLQDKNKQYEKRVGELEHKIKQKEAIVLRVSKIEKDLTELLQQNAELQKLNQSLSKSQLKVTLGEVEVQTQYFPLYVQDSYCQTYVQQPEYPKALIQLRMSDEGANEDWLNKAKIWKNQLELEKLAAFNRQTQFKAVVENIHIESRQRVEALQKQLELINMKYQSKCQQVKEKQGIINKYLLHK